jgi:hypothetical protein
MSADAGNSGAALLVLARVSPTAVIADMATKRLRSV